MTAAFCTRRLCGDGRCPPFAATAPDGPGTPAPLRFETGLEDLDLNLGQRSESPRTSQTVERGNSVGTLPADAEKKTIWLTEQSRYPTLAKR
jgi:hypothetical protein